MQPIWLKTKTGYALIPQSALIKTRAGHWAIMLPCTAYDADAFNFVGKHRKYFKAPYFTKAQGTIYRFKGNLK